MISSSYISGLVNNSSSALAESKLETLLASIMVADPGDKSVQQTEALKRFEGMFLSEMLKKMFDTIPVSDMFGGGSAEETFRSMIIDEYGTLIAKQGGIGIAENLQRTLLNQQLTEGSHVQLEQ